MTLRHGDRQLIREWNEGLVLDTIRRFQAVTRMEIAARTGLGRSTVTVISSRLLRQGLVAESGSLESGDVGRRPVLLRLQARSRSVLGVKLAPDRITAAVADLQAELCTTCTVPLPDADDPSAVLAQLTAVIRQAMDQAPDDMGPAIGLGLVMPGVINCETGSSTNPYHASWQTAPFRIWLEEALGLPVLVDNDANAAALAEASGGAGRGFRNLLCVTLGAGVGAGLVTDGRLQRGYRSAAGEIGHTVVDPDGPPCQCGNRGCLESLVSDAALQRQAGMTREELVKAARAGDAGARTLLAETGRRIGRVLAGAVNLVSPDTVVIGGEALFDAGDLLLAPITAALRSAVFPMLSDIQVVPAALGDQAWLKGAVALVLEEAFRVPLHVSGAEAITISSGEEG